MDMEKGGTKMSVRTPEPEERWLRERLAPTEDQVRRVVGHALRPESEAAPARGLEWRVPAAAAALALLAWGFIALGLRQRLQGTGQPPARHGPVALITNASGEVELVLPAAPSTAADRRPAGPAPGVVEIFNRDGCLAAVLPEGRVRYWIIGGDA